MIKQTQTIRRLSVFGYFVGLALKGLNIRTEHMLQRLSFISASDLNPLSKRLSLLTPSPKSDSLSCKLYQLYF